MDEMAHDTFGTTQFDENFETDLGGWGWPSIPFCMEVRREQLEKTSVGTWSLSSRKEKSINLPDYFATGRTTKERS